MKLIRIDSGYTYAVILDEAELTTLTNGLNSGRDDDPRSGEMADAVKEFARSYVVFKEVRL